MDILAKLEAAFGSEAGKGRLITKSEGEIHFDMIKSFNIRANDFVVTVIQSGTGKRKTFHGSDVLDIVTSQ